MAKYLSNRVRNINIGVSSITESDTVLTAIGNTDFAGKVDIDIGSGTTAFDIQGSAGQLFSVTNNLTSGSIFSVNDVSGIPSFNVDADGTVSIASFGGDVGVGTETPSKKLDVVGSVKASEQFISSVAIGTAPLLVTSTTLVSNLNADLLDGQQGSYYTGYTDTAIANLIDSSPGTLDTLNELAAALGDDANFSTTVTNSIATKLPKSGGQMTGNITFSGSQTVDGRDVSVDGSKLDGIETGATADQTAAEILTAIKTVDGSGSGLDADTLDGINSGSFLRSDAADTASGNITFTGAIIGQNKGSTPDEIGHIKIARVNGALSSIDTLDSFLLSKTDGAYPSGTKPSGTDNSFGVLSLQTHSGNYYSQLGFYSSGNALYLRSVYGSNTSFNSWSKVWHAGNDGSGSGLDADTLDGQQGSYYLNYNNFSNTPTIPTNNNQLTNGAGYVTSNTQLSNEQVQDIVGGMVSSNTESGITVTYEDSDGTLDFSVASQTDENFTTTLKNKLDGIESGATADQTKADIDALGIDADQLDGQEGSYYTGYTDTAIANLIDSSPGTLDTLNELAAALGDDANFSTTVTNSIATKLPLAGGTMTGNITFSGSQTVDGRDVSVDGSKLDSIESGATSDQTAAEILTAIKTVDGSGSGLDADLLDGISSGSFLRSDTDDTTSGKIIFGPNSTWSKYLIIGGNANNSNANSGSIGVTNGNLHIDAAAGGFASYLNYYDGTAGVGFGNGAQGNVAWMGPDGDLWKGSSDNSGSKYWHAGNDGSGSGLDADTLDGVQGSNYFNVEGKTKRWKVDLGNISYPKYYKVASVNQGSGGIHIKGSLNNHVESFGTSYFDLNIFGREDSNGANIVVSGTFGVSTPGTGLLVVKATTSTYARYDVYVIVTRYTQASVDITKEGTSTIDLSYASTTTKPTGLATEFDSGTTSQGLYVVNDSSIYKMWNASNDGASSGLDADLLDGQQGSYYLNYNNFSNTPTIPTNNNQLTNGAGYVTSNTQLSNEQVQDIVGGMVSGNTESGITVTYEDSDGTLDFSVASQTDNNFTTTLKNKLDGIEASADVTDATNVNAAGAVMNSDSTTASMSFVIDEDNMSSNSATKVPTQQSVKAYVDSEVSSLVDAAPGALDTLNELASAINDDANFSTTVTNSIATKLPLAGGTMTGNIIMSGTETVDGRDLSVDGTKLDGIESGATADQTAAEILTAIKTVDGSSSGLDADLLDGLQSSQLYRVYENTTISNYNSLTTGVWSTTSTTASNIPYANHNATWHMSNSSNDRQYQIFLGDSSAAGMYFRTKQGANTWHSWKKVWTDSNDGSGSGLDADLLDGQQGSYYLNYNNFTNTPTIPTNNNQLTNGAGYVTSNTQLSNEQVQDIVGGMVSSNTESGITVTYEDSDGTLDFSVASQTDENFTTTLKNKLDGIESGATADQTAAEILTAIKTVDGSGSGLDADTLDGINSGSFLRSDAADVMRHDTTSGEMLKFQNQTSGGKIQLGFQQQDSDGLHHRFYIKTYKGSATASGNADLIVRGAAGSTTSDILQLHSGTDARWRGSKIWTAGNDGASSGLDADLLDGQQGSHYLNYNNFTNTPTIPTNNNQLTNGAGYVTSNTQLSNEQVQDIVGGMVSSNTESGITVTYEDSDGTLDFSVASQTDNNFTTTLKNKLDGIETGATADQTAAEILTAIKTVDGSGSGLDADTLDGIGSGSFLRSDADDVGTGKIILGSTISSGSSAKLQVGGFQRTGAIMLAVGNSSTTSFNTTNERWIMNNGSHIYASTSSTSYNNKIWTDSNDGSGSGLDADKLDGQEGSYYTGYTDTAIANLIDSSPGTLDTLNELAAALGDDANFSTTITNSIATKLPLAGGQMTGNITFSGSQTVDGRDVSADGLKLDGIESNATADQTAAEILTAIKTVDGAGSGLDADLLDGIQASSFLRSDADDIFTGELYNGSLNQTPGGGKGALQLQPSTSGGSTGIFFNSRVNANSDGAYIWWYDDNDNYRKNNSSENGALVIGIQNDGNTTSEDAIAIESSGDIFLNPGNDGGFANAGGVTGPDFAEGKVYIGRATTKYEVWHAGNDGASSGLDADLLDGQQGSHYLNYNNFTNTPTIPTNNNQLTNGAGYVTANTQLSNEQVQDIVGGMVSSNTESGITVTYQDSDGTIDFSVASQTDENFTTTLKNKLDGIESGATADQTAAEILTAIKTVDGSGSGLDADTCDGQHLGTTTSPTFQNLTLSGTATPTIFLNGSSDTGVDMAIKATPEGIDFYEPEDGNKIHFRILDDTGVDAVFGYHINGTRIINSSRQLSNVTYGGNTIWHAGNDGSGSGLDADTLDGVQASSFLRSDAADTATGLITLTNGLHVTSGDVGIGTATPGYKLEVNGSFAATTKSFVIPHPTKQGYKLRYGSLEGPENGVYVRGQSKDLIINLPDYWTKLVDPNSITVNLTPIGDSAQPRVRQIENNTVEIFSKEEGELNYFYTVFAERVDVESLEVEINCSEID